MAASSTELRTAPARPIGKPLPIVEHEIRGRARFRLRFSDMTPERMAGISVALAAEPGVTAHRFNVRSRSLVVEHSGVAVGELADVIANAPPAEPGPVTARRRRNRHARSLAALAAGGALALAGQPLALPAIGLGAIPIFRRAARRLGRGKVGVDALDAAAMTITVATGQWLTAAVIGGLVEGGELLRDMTASRSRRELGALMSHQGATCWKLVEGRRVAVQVASIRPGDDVVVADGDRIPVDGSVVRGRAVVDERVMTGEPVPVTHGPGDSVFAMTVVTDGEMTVRAAGSAAESRAGRITSFLEKAPIGETRMADHARHFADRFVLPVMGIAAATYLVTGNASRAASILIFDLATGIRVAAPTTMLASVLAAAREGILIKGAAAMEKLAAVDAIVFDKTGTLTMGTPAVNDVIAFNGLSVDELLGVAAAADHGLNHPLASALTAEAERRSLKLPRRIHTRYHVGLGVEAELEDGQRYLVGNRAFLAEHGVRIPRRLDDHGLSEVVIAAGSSCLGLIVFTDEPRPEAAGVVTGLRARGVDRIVLLSGDTHDATRRVAEHLGITDWSARMSPDRKAAVVRRLKSDGHRVAVVGDGVNDSVALALADISIAMGGGADLARANSQIVLLDDRLELISLAIDRSRQSLGLMNQNLALIAAPNAIGLGGAVAGAMNPALAAFLSNGSTVVAAANGLRPLLGRPHQVKSG